MSSASVRTSFLSAGRGLPVLVLLPWLLIGFAGVLFLTSTLLWDIWTTDALRSIGIYFPIVSIVLILRVWRQLGWETQGTWWGVLPLFYAVVTGFAGSKPEVYFFALKDGVQLLPLGLTVFAYASGVVLLLGGTHVWRKALFPLSLLLFVNPVPSVFRLVDLPLQYLCARTARTVALAIGVHPDGNQLRLLFAPGFGMFIAPGCNGMRGAVTMGYLALVLGYLYRFSLRLRVFLVSAAVTLGYIFNLMRLIALVLFYWAALRFPVLQAHAEKADYLLGGCLFLCAVVLFALVVQWKGKRAHNQDIAGTRTPDCVSSANLNKSALFCKGVAVSVLAMLSVCPYLGSVRIIARSKADSGESAPVFSGIMSEHMGKYRLSRTWLERDSQIHPLYRWGTYRAGNTPDEIDIGLYLGSQPHYPILCHLVRGDKPLWQRIQRLPTANGDSATFDMTLYEGGEGQTLEATTVCDERGCNENALLLRSPLGVVFADFTQWEFALRPTSSFRFMLIRKQSGDLALASATGQPQILQEVEDFILGMNMQALAGVRR